MPDGYEIRGKSVRVYFRYEGELCREKIGDNTPENIERAKRLAQIIKLEQESGTFEYRRHFPESDKVQENSFEYYANLYLDIRKTQVAHSTLVADRSKFRTTILPRWGNTRIQDIDFIALQQWIATDLEKLHNKTIKSTISLMSQVFELYSTRQKHHFNPSKGIKIRLPDSEDPDPFSLDEINRLLSQPTDLIQHREFVEFMIWDGCRLSEATALCWEDIVNLDEGIVRYQRARVVNRWKVTKTKRSTRTHRLLKPAREVLKRQYDRTANLPPIEIDVVGRDNKTIRKMKVRPVFRKDSNMESTMDKTINEKFFQPHCEAAGIRYRPASQCRHTFISQMLTLGIVPLHWIASHVGHTTTDMIQKNYGKWIQEDGPDVQTMIEKVLDL